METKPKVMDCKIFAGSLVVIGLIVMIILVMVI